MSLCGAVEVRGDWCGCARWEGMNGRGAGARNDVCAWVMVVVASDDWCGCVEVGATGDWCAYVVEEGKEGANELFVW